MGWKVTADPDLVRRVQRIRIAERFPGWTLDYIDALTIDDFHEYLQVRDGIAKARKTKR